MPNLALKYLHTMIRAGNLEDTLDFYVNKLGLKEIRRHENTAGRHTLVFLAPPGQDEAQIEITWNWDEKDYTGGRNFGHLAYEVENIYDKCQDLMDKGVKILRPPRDGMMAFVRSPDGISIEFLQKDFKALPKQEPWASMQNQGEW
jgi:lactoylglutathione lyase